MTTRTYNIDRTRRLLDRLDERLPDQTCRRWEVVCDDETWYTRTREEARELARQIAAHPGTRDIRRFGPYRNATGRVIVRRCTRDRCRP